jgi:hypothetical protein
VPETLSNSWRKIMMDGYRFPAGPSRLSRVPRV